MGVHLTTAVKCGKTCYGLKSSTVEEYSCIIEKELSFFHQVKAYILMDDMAIKALNYITERRGVRVISTGFTYKIRE